jgi:hypothetical protein
MGQRLGHDAGFAAGVSVGVRSPHPASPEGEEKIAEKRFEHFLPKTRRYGRNLTLTFNQLRRFFNVSYGKEIFCHFDRREKSGRRIRESPSGSRAVSRMSHNVRHDKQNRVLLSINA